METKVKKIEMPSIYNVLGAFPLVLYTITLIAFLSYYSTENTFWFRVGYVANVAGVVMAIIASLPAFLDWTFGIPRPHKAKRADLLHVFFNLTALAFFVINLGTQMGQWNDLQPVANDAVLLSAIGYACAVVGAFYGWSLVQIYKIPTHAKQTHTATHYKKSS